MPTEQLSFIEELNEIAKVKAGSTDFDGEVEEDTVDYRITPTEFRFTEEQDTWWRSSWMNYQQAGT